MIFDYLVDFKYLARVIPQLEPGDPTLDNFKRIIDACRNDDENGRLVLDWDRKLLKDMMAMTFAHSRFGQRCQYVLEERFLRLLPASVAAKRSEIGRPSSPGGRICVRDVPVFENGFEKVMGKLRRIDPPPNMEVSDREDDEGGAVRLDDDAHFDVVDGDRRGLKAEQRVCTVESRIGLVSVVEFWRQLHCFGAAETKRIEIFDPYVFKGTRSGNENLFRWIAHLLGGQNLLRKNVEVVIYSRCGRNDFTCKPEGMDRLLAACYRRMIGETGLEHLRSVSLELQFLFAVDGDDDVCQRFRTDVQHDRFVATTTHYFGIGSGVDSPVARTEFNVQYKSRIREGLPNVQLEELRGYFSNAENVRLGRVRRFVCRVVA